MDAHAVRRWIDGFEAAATADRREAAKRGPDRERAIALSLSLIAEARRTARPDEALARLREAEDDAVRRTWALLRARGAR